VPHPDGVQIPEAVIPKGSVLPDRPFSPAVRDGRLLFIAGHVGVDANWQTVAGGFESQARQVFLNISDVLTAASADWGDVREMTIYLTSIDDFGTFDRVRREFLQGPPFPASTAVEVSRLLNPDWLIEISATAVVGDPK
jgi:enamine deaminase RidA (YjgF/YER057c/UK114 family)